jgi:hypothetical protein
VVADAWAWFARRLDIAKDIGVLERDFWEMTPGTFDEWHEIHVRRETREYERAAWMVSRIMAAWVKSPPSVDDLLGRMKTYR